MTIDNVASLSEYFQQDSVSFSRSFLSPRYESLVVLLSQTQIISIVNNDTKKTTTMVELNKRNVVHTNQTNHFVYFFVNVLFKKMRNVLINYFKMIVVGDLIINQSIIIKTNKHKEIHIDYTLFHIYLTN